MTKLISFIILSICAFSSNAETIKDSLLVDNHYRVFYFSRPQASSKNASLVFAMHGSGGNAPGLMLQAVKLESKAAAENLIIAYPQGYKNYWNECRKASTVAANLENINEDAFFIEMIRYFKTRYQINDQHVFATGFSGGGQMAYRMGIRIPGKFKGIAAMVANMPVPENMDCIEAKLPISTLIINGTADAVNPYKGGEMKAGVTLGFVRSTEESFRYWAKLSGYEGEPAKGILPDADTTNNIAVESYTFKKTNAPEVTLYKVINGKHEFPKDIDLFEVVWDFFKRQI